MITDPTTLFAVLSAILGLVFWLSRLGPLQKLFEIVPPVIWAYFVPMLTTTAGLTPSENPLYDWMSAYLLPVALLLLMVAVDLPAILRLGRLALIMMLAGTLGIVIGGPISFGLLGGLFDDPETWKGFAALSGSWIGGTANMVAVQTGVGASADVLAPIIVVDVVVGYGWLGILIFLSAYQERFDRWTRADRRVVADLNAGLAALDQSRRPPTLADLALMTGLAFGGVALARLAAGALPPVGDPTIISRSTWVILIVVTVGLALSFTPLRRLEQVGASRVGYLALYLLLTSIGAKADLRAVLDVPGYLLVGVVWIAIHVAVLIGAAKLFRAPMFLVATGSMANVGGAASAPVVAGVYHPALAPVGLLMGISGYILGIYAAFACAYLISLVAV